MNRRKRAILSLNTFGIAVLLGTICNFGCGGPGSKTTKPTPEPVKPNVAMIINQGGYYNVLIEEGDNRITTKMYSVYKVTFVLGLKPDEKMWLENDPAGDGKVLIHVHSVKMDIKINAGE
jgi:hypothetical protein